MDTYDVAVIGAGFGGLGCALELASRGAKVAVFERLNYPGGCASTFERRGYKFESGATLFSGFDDHQLFGTWIERFGLGIDFQAIDPIVEMRFGEFELDVPRDREALVEAFCAMDGAPQTKIRKFFERQKRVADALWALFNDPDLLPPFSASALLEHIRRSPRYLRLVPLVGRTLASVLDSWGVGEFEPLRRYLDAVCQITVQTSVDEVEAPFALGAMDYYFRGTGHVHGGIGELAWAIAGAIEDNGGDVFFADQVNRLAPVTDGWIVESRRREIEVDQVAANLLPSAVSHMLPPDAGSRTLERLSDDVQRGWGAAMLYLGLEPGAELRPEAHHLELVGDPDESFIEGNHVFCSISGEDETDRSPDGGRTVTCSTHVDMDRLLGNDDEAQAAYIDDIHERMRSTIQTRAPQLARWINFEMTASPRTFERFTGRPQGFVGGIPRRAGLSNYRRLAPSSVIDGLYLVGDSVFPGQSTLATTLGGVRTAEAMLR
ncbi:MAG: phytoene desaturase family protein [Myxococcota bacterium]